MVIVGLADYGGAVSQITYDESTLRSLTETVGFGLKS